MQSIYEQIRAIQDKVAATTNHKMFSSKYFEALCDQIKKDLPNHYEAAVGLAKTHRIDTSRAGARTCHYLSFDIDNYSFTENQKTKLNNLYKGESRTTDPNIGRKPSQAEILFRAALKMAAVMIEDGTRKTY